MQPIRGERDDEFCHDPWNKTAQQSVQKDTTHVLNDAGAIESHRVGRRFACVCGCLKPPGGFCAVCAESVCVDCHGFCGRCHMPLCPRHSVFEQDGGGTIPRWCKACFATRSRGRLVRKLARAILSPFVRFGDEHAKR